MSSSNFDIKDYRQPLVTSLCVILAFQIGFLAHWVSDEDFALQSASDYTAFIGCAVGCAVLIYTLFRMLSPAPAPELIEAHYHRSLKFYALGISLSLLAVLVAGFI